MWTAPVARSKCPTLEIPQGDTVTAGGELSEQEEKAFKEAFSANLIDTSLGLNVLGESDVMTWDDANGVSHYGS